ncbi:hypothetical protein C4580_05845 [Candidatus Woesearchaeota archaeon]|nr:MAG: hypothetical protein C4580_05845 [Candidatus Woesearchaeota archaeon]
MGKTISGPITFRNVVDQLELAVKKYLADAGNQFGFYASYNQPLQPDASHNPWSVDKFIEQRPILERDPIVGQFVYALFQKGLFDEFCARDDAATSIDGTIQGALCIQTHVLNFSAMKDTAEGLAYPDPSNQQYLIWNYNEHETRIAEWAKQRDAALEKLEARAKANAAQQRPDQRKC